MIAPSFVGSRSRAWLALVMSALCGCNLILDNEKRSLAERSVTAAGTGAIPWSGSDSGQDAAPPGPPLDYDAGSCESAAQRCVPGMADMLQESCSSCGSGLRVRERICTPECQWGPYGEWSECVVPEEVCEPGKVQDKVEPCGPCDKGTRRSTRTCSSACAWSAWKEEECDADESLCEPGSHMELPAVTCDAMCGKSQQVRTCTASCTWGPVESGECEGQGPCKPGETRMADSAGCNPDYCMKGVQPQMQTCTNTCNWGTPTNKGNCTIPEGVCRPKDLGSTTGYRCIEGDPGFRQLCRPSTASPDERCTYAGREAYSGC